MKIASFISRGLLALIFIVFGSNMFLHFIPIKVPSAEPAREFMTALSARHYFYLVGALQLAGGVLLLSGRWVPLALALLWPVIVNIFFFHALMAPDGLPMAIIVSALALPSLVSSRQFCRNRETRPQAHRFLTLRISYAECSTQSIPALHFYFSGHIIQT